MKNTIIIIVVVVAIIVVLGFLFVGPGTNNTTNNNQNERIGEIDDSEDTLEEGETHTTVRGTIVGINKEEAMTDGPFLVQLESDAGEVYTIAIPSMGINLCPAEANIADIESLEVGMEVEARGIEGEDGQIVPCTSEGHYVIEVDDES